MKRVLCLIDTLSAGGAQRQLVGLASFLKERGYDVTVAAYYDDLFYERELKTCEVPYVYIKQARKTTFRIWYIARFIRKFKPDVVIAYLETPSICACIAKIFIRGFKLIVSERNTTQHTGFNEKIRFNLFRVANYVVPNSYSQEAYMISTFPNLTKKIVTIPNFVDLDYFMPLYKSRKVIPEIMVAASIWPSKNTLGFIDAVALLKEKKYQFHISWYGIIGNNAAHLEYVKQCNDKIEQQSIGDFITLKEKTTQIKSCYQESDFFCLPSLFEGTPNVICEAMACGLPIVCSDICDNSHYVEDGKNGFLFDPKDTSNIVAAFERMFALSNEEYISYCRNSREKAALKLAKESFINKYISLLES